MSTVYGGPGAGNKWLVRFSWRVTAGNVRRRRGAIFTLPPSLSFSFFFFLRKKIKTKCNIKKNRRCKMKKKQKKKTKSERKSHPTTNH